MKKSAIFLIVALWLISTAITYAATVDVKGNRKANKAIILDSRESKKFIKLNNKKAIEDSLSLVSPQTAYIKQEEKEQKNLNIIVPKKANAKTKEVKKVKRNTLNSVKPQTAYIKPQKANNKIQKANDTPISVRPQIAYLQTNEEDIKSVVPKVVTEVVPELAKDIEILNETKKENKINTISPLIAESNNEITDNYKQNLPLIASKAEDQEKIYLSLFDNIDKGEDVVEDEKDYSDKIVAAKKEEKEKFEQAATIAAKKEDEDQDNNDYQENAFIADKKDDDKELIKSDLIAARKEDNEEAENSYKENSIVADFKENDEKLESTDLIANKEDDKKEEVTEDDYNNSDVIKVEEDNNIEEIENELPFAIEARKEEGLEDNYNNSNDIEDEDVTNIEILENELPFVIEARKEEGIEDNYNNSNDIEDEDITNIEIIENELPFAIEARKEEVIEDNHNNSNDIKVEDDNNIEKVEYNIPYTIEARKEEVTEDNYNNSDDIDEEDFTNIEKVEYDIPYTIEARKEEVTEDNKDQNSDFADSSNENEITANNNDNNKSKDTFNLENASVIEKYKEELKPIEITSAKNENEEQNETDYQENDLIAGVKDDKNKLQLPFTVIARKEEDDKYDNYNLEKMLIANLKEDEEQAEIPYVITARKENDREFYIIPNLFIKKEEKNNKDEIKEIKPLIAKFDINYTSVPKLEKEYNITSDIIVRNCNLTHDKGIVNNMELGTNKIDKNEAMLRVGLDANVNKNMSVHTRWNLVGYENVNEINKEHGMGRFENNKIDIANLLYKNLFKNNSIFVVGRDLYTHGHGLIINDYVDSVKYTKKGENNVNFGINVFNIKNDTNKKDENYIVNINADYNYKGHNMYLGAYYNEKEKNTKKDENNNRAIRVEFGSEGILNKKTSYDFGIVYNDIQNGIINIKNEIEDGRGLLSYFGFDYNFKKNTSIKLSYANASDESLANIKVNNQGSSFNEKPTIFDDVFLFTNGYNIDTNMTIQNITDVKVQLNYKDLKTQKNNLRLAYDFIENKYDNKTNTLNLWLGNPYPGFIDHVKANLFTADYIYKFNKNSRIRFAYQVGELEAIQMPTQKIDYFVTEYYNKF